MSILSGEDGLGCRSGVSIGHRRLGELCHELIGMHRGRKMRWITHRWGCRHDFLRLSIDVCISATSRFETSISSFVHLTISEFEVALA